MTIVEIKFKLHAQIEHCDERLLKIIYAIVNEYEKREENIEESRKKLILDEREKHLARTSKSYSWKEVKNMAKDNQKSL